MQASKNGSDVIRVPIPATSLVDKEVYISKIENVSQINKLMEVKVKFVQGHFYIFNFGIWTFNPYVGISCFGECFLSFLSPQTEIQNSMLEKSNVLVFWGPVQYLIRLKSIGQSQKILAEIKMDKPNENKRIWTNVILISTTTKIELVGWYLTTAPVTRLSEWVAPGDIAITGTTSISDTFQMNVSNNMTQIYILRRYIFCALSVVTSTVVIDLTRKMLQFNAKFKTVN